MSSVLERAERLELSFEGEMSTVEGILALVQEWSARNGAAYDDRLSLRLILEELLINVCLHGQQGNTKAVTIRLCIEPREDGHKKEFRISLWDNGMMFNPLSHSDVDIESIESAPIGQRGLSLVRLLTDNADYSYTDGNNFSFTFSLDAEYKKTEFDLNIPSFVPGSQLLKIKDLWKNNIAFRQTALFTLCAIVLIWCAMSAFYFGTKIVLAKNTGSLAMQSMYTQSMVNSSFLRRIEAYLEQVSNTIDALQITPQKKLFLQNAQALYNFLQHDLNIGSVETPVLGIMAGIEDKAWFFRIGNGVITNRYSIKNFDDYLNQHNKNSQWQTVVLPFETFGMAKDSSLSDPHAPIMYSKALSQKREEGWIGVVITMPFIAESLKNLSGFSSAVPMLFDSRGQYVIFPPGRSLQKGPQSFAEEATLTNNSALARLEQQILSGEKGSLQLRSIFGKDETVWDLPWQGPTSLIYYPMEIPGWHLALLVDSYELGNAPTPFPLSFLLVALLGPLCIGAITWFVTSRTLRPLRALNASIGKLSEGDTQSPFQPSTFPDEVGTMLTAFNRVRVTLRTSFRNLVLNTTKQQRLMNELEVARNTQNSMLLHTLPQVPGVSLAASLDMAREVCGDLYSCFVDPNNGQRVHFVMGDVCGKGIPAALIMSRAVALARSFLTEEQSSPAKTLQRLNTALLRVDSSCMFVSMLVATFDTSTNTFHWASAGHPPPLWTGKVNKDDKHYNLQHIQIEGKKIYYPVLEWSQELVLNVQAAQTYTDYALILEPGASLMLYTDGASEAMGTVNGQENTLYGEERLQTKFIQAWHENSHAENILQEIRQDLFKHMQEKTPTDDISLLVISREKVL